MARIDTVDILSQSWFTKLQKNIRARRNIEKKIDNYKKQKRIEEAIEKRFTNIHTDQSRWLNGIQSKYKDPININRLLTISPDGDKFITSDKDEVQRLTSEFFEKTFRKRYTKLDNMSPMWQEIYRP